MILTAVGAFVGALLSLLASAYIEFQRKPKLTFEIENPPEDRIFEGAPAKNVRFLRVRLRNQGIPRLLQWFGRHAAMQCTGEIQFHDTTDGIPLFAKAMRLRWSGSTEPLTPQLTADNKIALVFDPAIYLSGFRRDCLADDMELIDIAARFDADDECYGWSNETYINGWRNKDWKLSKGRYLVTVKVHSEGETATSAFKLGNASGRADFRLLPATDEDKKKLKVAR